MKLRSIVLVLVLLAAPIASAPSASAHAALESTTPAKGAVVGKYTKQVSMIFGEEILQIKGKSPNSISVIDSDGKFVSIGAVKVSGMKISESLKTPLIAGRYIVKYRVVSADGHVVTGSYNFTVK
jgi:methionine-rich copper-binding protein CopC